jgi:hypothetical protein
MVIQRSYSINPPVGFPGTIAEPNSPMRIEIGTLYIDSGDPRATATPPGARPGDAVYYDNTNNAWRVAYDSASQLAIEGIITYPADTVAGANSFVAFASGDAIEVITMGVVWVIAGAASERGDQLLMHTDDWKYDNLTRRTTVAELYSVPIQSYNTTPAVDNAIIKASIGYGRVI